jgi:hypothetical protein
MGQEFSASSPFYYFADHEPELAALVRKGRRDFMGQFPSIADFAADGSLPDPAAFDTFVASKLDWRECEQHAVAVNLHRDLIRLRKQDAIFSQQNQSIIEGAVIGPEALLLRWFDAGGQLSTWGATSADVRPPNHCGHRPSVAAGICCGPARIDAMEEAALRKWTKQIGASLGMLPSCGERSKHKNVSKECPHRLFAAPGLVGAILSSPPRRTYDRAGANQQRRL